tara:strand:- start:203 stop:328 length:126 start_codon:yes stop_codon:yes gene_type:complete
MNKKTKEKLIQRLVSEITNHPQKTILLDIIKDQVHHDVYFI